jgi:hypothetical protein
MNRKEKNGSPSAHPNCLSLEKTQSATLSFPRQSIKTNNANSCNLPSLFHLGGVGSLGERQRAVPIFCSTTA